jgi:hypothetical protein
MRLLLMMTKMLTNATFEPPADFADPRLKPSFKFRLWPLCNGGPGPEPESSGLYQRRCLEFLTAFYQLNVANQRLLDARKARASKKVIKSCLDDVASATADLEAIEDRYAPIGFFGEPVMDGIRYQNIVFICPEVPRQYPPAPKEALIFAIPGLEAIPKSELRGRAKLRRFGNARLDL